MWIALIIWLPWHLWVSGTYLAASEQFVLKVDVRGRKKRQQKDLNDFGNNQVLDKY